MKSVKLMFVMFALNFLNIVFECGASNEFKLGLKECVERRNSENENFYREFIRENVSSTDEATNRMDLRGRQMKSLDQSIFRGLSTVEIAILDVSINRLCEISVGVFEKFSNLRILMMGTNDMEMLNETSFLGLMMLEELNLSRNMISDISSATFRQMANLRTIDLSENCIFHLPNYAFFRNVHLTKFLFARNHISTLPLLMPTNQPIITMNLTTNKFTNMSSILPYFNIQSLDLSHNRLEPKEMVGKFSSSSSSSSSSENESISEVDDDTLKIYIRHHHSNINRIEKNRRSKRTGQEISSMEKWRHWRLNEISIKMKKEKEEEEEGSGSNGKDTTTMMMMLDDLEVKDIAVASNDGMNSIRKRNTIEQWDELMKKSKSVSRMEYFTCRNCSLISMTFLEQFNDLKYIDVSINSIRTIELSRKSFQNLETLLLSSNRIENFLSRARILNTLPKLTTLKIDNNPNIRCTQLSDIKYQASHLSQFFQLQVDDKCK